MKIVSVGRHIASRDVLNISFDGIETFLDADLLIIDPLNINDLWSGLVEKRDTALHRSGRLSFEEYSAITGKFERRKREIETLLRTKKVIMVFLWPVFGARAYDQYGNEGPFVTNYDWLPFGGRDQLIETLQKGTGSEIVLKSSRTPLSQYYLAFKAQIVYHVYCAREIGTSFLLNKSGHPVGFYITDQGGCIAFVPPPPSNADAEKLVGVLRQCALKFVTDTTRSPEPDWAAPYAIPGESVFNDKIETVQGDIRKLADLLKTIEAEREALTLLRGLLYEQGEALENAVLKAMTILGFKAERFKKADMEHDIIMSAPEGIAVGEVEGRDKDAIHVEKLDQLGRVVDEYYMEHGVYPEGLLIGNPYRLTPPEKRKPPFTDKALGVAKRKKFGLLTCPELFKATIRILEDPQMTSLRSISGRLFWNREAKRLSSKSSESQTVLFDILRKRSDIAEISARTPRKYTPGF